MPSSPTQKTPPDSSTEPTSSVTERTAGVAIPVIMLVMFTLPFTLLREVNTVYGSFAVFTIGTLVVIGLATYLTRNWK